MTLSSRLAATRQVEVLVPLYTQPELGGASYDCLGNLWIDDSDGHDCVYVLADRSIGDDHDGGGLKLWFAGARKIAAIAQPAE
jgi:hypothetical protein